MRNIVENLVTLTVNSTHFYLIECKNGMLLVDAGWGLPQFSSQLKSHKIPFSDIRYVMFTHHHPDHAGIVQEVKDLSGARLIIHEKQVPFLQNLLAYSAKKGGYVPIRIEQDDLVSPDKSVLQSIGIYGEILETPGHSKDSISLVLDSGCAFTGDLPLPDFSGEENAQVVRASWDKLISHHVQVVYPSHTDPIPIARIKEHLSG